MHAIPNIAEDERDPVTGEPASAYVPPADAPIPLATPRPKVKSLDKKKVGAVVGVASALILIAFVSAFSPKAPQSSDKKDDPTQGTAAMPAESINALPADYGAAAAQRAQEQQAAGVPQLGPPMPGELGQMQLETQQAAGMPVPPPSAAAGGQTYATPAQPTPAQQYAMQQQLERLRRAEEASKAGTGFGGAGAAGAGAAAAAGPLSPDQLAAQYAAAAGAAPGAPAMPPAGPSDAQLQRDAANRQDDKRAFSRERGESGVLAGRVMPPASPYVVGAGTIIPALFLTGVNSDLPGQVTAQVSQPVYDSPTGRHVVIPQGSILIGTYDSRITFGQARVLLVWQRLRFPNGASLDLEAMPGVDLSGYAGVRDRVNNHWGKVTGSVILSSLLSGAMAVSQGDSFSAFQKDAGQAAAQGAAQQVNQVGSQIVQRAINVQPTLEIRPGQRVAVMVNKDLALTPYGQ